MYFAPNAQNTLAAQPACGCAAPTPFTSAIAPTPFTSAIAPLPRSLTPFAPTTAWSSNLFAAERGAADGTGTGQLAPSGSGMPAWESLAAVAGTAGTALGAYHGYKRTGSLGWAIGWGLLGGLFPFITIPVALAQGFGRPEPSFR